MTTKIDPITAVQDSIDSLALSLFEALRGVRDAVAPQSLSAAPVATSNKEDVEPITSENARGELKQILPEGVEIPSEYLSRAFDLLEPDYYAFFLAYLSGDEYSRELVERFRALSDASAAPAKGVSGTSSELTNSANPLISQEESHSSEVELGNVGYKFRKLFDAGWFDGKVIEIRPLAEGGKDRRVLYTDGDMEDLSLDDLQELAKLDPNYSVKKPRLSIKLKLNKSNSNVSNSGGGEAKAIRDNGPSNNAQSRIPRIPRSEQEYIKLLHQYELERDTLITQQLAQNILTKSAEVDNLVANLPGMTRTRQMQLDRIAELIEKNKVVARELDESFGLATRLREEVRVALEKHTCLALGLSS
ncbi:hypothetical protein ACHAWX_002248 [Stephanocyclus meneghinianus]